MGTSAEMTRIFSKPFMNGKLFYLSFLKAFQLHIHAIFFFLFVWKYAVKPYAFASAGLGEVTEFHLSLRNTIAMEAQNSMI